MTERYYPVGIQTFRNLINEGTDDSFSVVTDFYHFANGKSTEDFWAPVE